MAIRLMSGLPININEVTTWYSEALVLQGHGQAEKTEETVVTEEQLIIRLTGLIGFPRVSPLSPTQGQVLAEGKRGCKGWDHGAVARLSFSAVPSLTLAQ